MVTKTRYWWEAPPEVSDKDVYAWRSEQKLLHKMEPWRTSESAYDVVGMLNSMQFKAQELSMAFGSEVVGKAQSEIKVETGRKTAQYVAPSYDLWEHYYGVPSPTAQYTPGQTAEIAKSQKQYYAKITDRIQHEVGIHPYHNLKLIREYYPEWSAEYQQAQSLQQQLEGAKTSLTTAKETAKYWLPRDTESFVIANYPKWSSEFKTETETARARVSAKRKERLKEPKEPPLITTEEKTAAREGKTATEYAEWLKEETYTRQTARDEALAEYKKAGIGTPEFYDYMERELEDFKDPETGRYDIWGAYQSGKFPDIQLKGMFGEEVGETLFQMRKQAGYAGREPHIPREYAPPVVEEPRVTMGPISGAEYAGGKETALVLGQPIPPPRSLSDLENLERIDYRRKLIEWAKEQGITDPEKFASDVMAKRTGEVTMSRAGEQAAEQKLPPGMTWADYYRPVLERFLVDRLGDTNFSHTLQLYTKKEVASVLGQSLARLPQLTAAAILQLPQGWGGASAVNKGWADRYIALANEDIDKFTQEVTKLYPSIPALREAAQISRNLAYSITSMGTGLAVGVPIAYLPLPGARYAAWAAGTSASGWAAYQMTTYQIMQEYLELKNEENIQQTGRELTIEEENKLKQDFSSLAKKYGLWEAIPEALSNLAFGMILVGPLGKMIGGPMAQKIVTKIGMMYGEELLTETITQKGQSDIEVVAGLRENRISLWEAFKEIAPQTFLLTTIMAGAGQVIVSSSQAITKAKNSLKKEIGEKHPLYEEIKKGIETGTIPTEGIQVPVKGRAAVEGIAMPAEVQQELLARADTWLQQVENVKPNTLHTVGVAEGEAFIRTDAEGKPLIAGLSLMREGQLTLSTIVAVPGKEMAVGRSLVEIGEYIKANNIAFGPRAEMSPEAIRIYDKLVTKGITPEAVKPTATAGKDTAIDSIIGELTTAIKTAKPARAETELLKTAERARRIPRAREAALAAKPEEAAFAAMGQLKGELPTAQFIPPETAITPDRIRAIYAYLRQRLLTDGQDSFKWLNTDAALRKLLGGKIPTRGDLVLLEDVFGSDLIEAILSKRPLSEKALENILDVMNVPRAVLASGDLSAWLRQGAFIVTAHPKIGAGALVVDIKTLLSGKYAAELDQSLRTSKYAPLREKAGLFLGPIEGAAARLSQREELFMSRLVKKIPFIGPWVKVSERAYVSTLNYMRAMTFDSYAAKWEGQGYSPETYRQLATLINWATGRGPIGKLAPMTPALNAVFFATRLQTSRAAMLFGGYKFTSPPVRKAYARMMVSFFGTMGGIVALGALAGLWETEKDPRSSDFGKIRIGNTRLDPWAGFQPIARLIAQLITATRKTATGRIQDISRMETLERFLRSKASPAFGLAWDIAEGETFIGEGLSLEAGSIAEQVYQRLTPLFIQDLIDAIKEEGWLGGFIALPGAFGVGIVSYPGSIDAYERHVPEIPEDMLLDWQKGIQVGGGQLTYQNLNSLQRAWLRRHCEEIGDEPERKEAGTYNFYEAQSKTYEEFEALLTEEMQPIIEGYRAGRISLSDYIDQSEHLRSKYFGQASTLWLDSMREKLDPLLHKNLERWHEEEIKPEDVAYTKYMGLRANPPKINGVPDWDSWERNLTRFMDGQSEEVKNYIKQRRIDWINKLSPERQSIEKLILDCESVLDGYYTVNPEKFAEYKALHPELEKETIISRLRQEYRDEHPEVDARLIILRGLKPRSGFKQAFELLEQHDIAISPQMEKEYEEWVAGQPLREAEKGWTEYIDLNYESLPKGDARYRARDNDPYLDAILFVTGKTTVLRKANLDEAERHVLRLMGELGIKPKDIPAFANNMPKFYKMANKWEYSAAPQETPPETQETSGYWWEK